MLNLFTQVCSGQGLLQGPVWTLELGSTVAPEKGKPLESVVMTTSEMCVCFYVVRYVTSLHTVQSEAHSICGFFKILPPVCVVMM